MGGSGKKLPGGGARHKVNTPRPTAALGAGAIPHPLRLTVGQRFVPLRPRRQRPLMITRLDRDGTVRAVKEDGARERVELRATRLLACDEERSGIHYRFIGYRAGRRYRTFAYVARVGADAISLVLPDWHPSRTVSYPRRLAPGALAGCWVELTADLGQAQAAALNPAELFACADPGGERCHRPDSDILQQVVVAGERPRPSLGRGCDDIVLEAPAPQRDLPGGAIEFHVAPHVQLHSGGRLYLPGDGTRAVTGYLDVLESEPTPNGTRVRCLGAVHPVDVGILLGGPLLSGRWRWRWWPRELECGDCVVQPAVFCYDAVAHCDDIRWPAPGQRDDARGRPAGGREK